MVLSQAIFHACAVELESAHQCDWVARNGEGSLFHALKCAFPEVLTQSNALQTKFLHHDNFFSLKRSLHSSKRLFSQLVGAIDLSERSLRQQNAAITPRLCLCKNSKKGFSKVCAIQIVCINICKYAGAC
jgi:hypothetical protein